MLSQTEYLNTNTLNFDVSHLTAQARQELVDFYKQAMTAKGWAAGMSMVQGPKGMLMLKKSNRQLVFKIKGKGDAARVDITMISQ